MPKYIIALVGRPNVGKSTLFNRIVGERAAIVDPTPGVTRDRKYAETDWTGKNFVIIDTGGYVPESDDVFDKAIREQAQIAIDEADAVVLVVDGHQGIHPLDRELAGVVRKSKKPVSLAVNKIDSEKHDPSLHEFHSLGLGDPLPISAISGRQVGDFLDAITAQISLSVPEEQSDKRMHLAVIGKPNVGKSSLLNALTGTERSIVTEIPGTTRDPVDSILRFKGEEIVLLDTAGLRKRRKVRESLEFYSAVRTLKTISRCDVAIVMFDASQGVDKQDLHILTTALREKKPVIIAVNKWDLVEKDSMTAAHWEGMARAKLRMNDYLPIIFISALTKQRIYKLIEVARVAFDEREKRIDTNELNEILLPIIERTPPSSSVPKEIKIKYITQIRSNPPVFAFFCSQPKLVQESYKRFLEKAIREHFGFAGIPITLTFKQK